MYLSFGLQVLKDTKSAKYWLMWICTLITVFAQGHISGENLCREHIFRCRGHTFLDQNKGTKCFQSEDRYWVWLTTLAET